MIVSCEFYDFNRHTMNIIEGYNILMYLEQHIIYLSIYLGFLATWIWDVL